MGLDSASLMQASGPLRAYGGAGLDKDREEAQATLSGLMLAARRDDDVEAYETLYRAQALLRTGHAGANAADNLLDALSRSRAQS